MSKLADYAFILLSIMGEKNGAAWAASDLAVRTTLPVPTVAKIMKMLAKGGVVTAQRGASGGYRMARTARTTSLALIIEAIDGPIALTSCIARYKEAQRQQAELGIKGDISPCAINQNTCPMHGSWEKVNNSVLNALQTVSLADLMPALDQRATHR